MSFELIFIENFLLSGSIQELMRKEKCEGFKQKVINIKGASEKWEWLEKSLEPVHKLHGGVNMVFFEKVDDLLPLGGELVQPKLLHDLEHQVVWERIL